MQQARGVAAKYRIDTQQVVAPHDAKLKASGQLRSLVAVFALGAILLFVVISVADALIAIRSERAERVDHGMAEEIGVGAPLVPLDLDSRNGSPSWPEAWPASEPKRIA
jgi:hypothetical protein